jgi:hypothetical protein
MSFPQLLRSANQLARSLVILCPRCTASLNTPHHQAPQIFRLPFHTSAGQLRKKNDLPDDFEIREKVRIPKSEQELGDLVYTGTIAKHMYATKIISLTSSAMGIAIQPVLYEKMAQLPVALQAVVGGVCSFFIFITPFLLHLLVRQYIIRLYYNPETEEFNAITMKFLPSMKKVTNFAARDVEIPAIPGMFTTFTVRQGEKKVPFFVNPPDFLSDQAYIKLMSYDEPMDVIRGPQFEEKKRKHVEKK